VRVAGHGVGFIIALLSPSASKVGAKELLSKGGLSWGDVPSVTSPRVLSSLPSHHPRASAASQGQALPADSKSRENWEQNWLVKWMAG